MRNLSLKTRRPISVCFSNFDRKAAGLWYSYQAERVLRRAIHAAWRFLNFSALKKEVAPDHIAPDHIAPDHIAPDYIAPDHIGPDHIGMVSVVFSDDGGLRNLNRLWRGINKATNVLAFPAADNEALEIKQHKSQEFSPLGDIFLSWESWQRESKIFNLLPAAHLSHLGIHGFLHLGGMDHQNFSERRQMEKIETAILARLGYKNLYHYC